MATVTTALKNILPLKIGGGGFISGYDIHADGTLVCRADVYGAYLWNATTSLWEQLVTTTSMPSGDVHVDFNDGTFEIAIAPSNSSIFYMAYLGYVYKSVNRGTTWTRTAFTRISNMEPGHTTESYFSPKIAIDPLDANVVYFGTSQDGLWYTRDGGANWTQVASGSVPFGTVDATSGTYPGILGVIINPYAAAVSGRSGTIWASSHNNGYYRSTDGGETWATVASGPSSSVRSSCFATDGQLYCVDYAQTKLYRFDTAWNNTAKVIQGCMCDPFDAARVLVWAGGGTIYQSADRGATFGSAISPVTRNASSTGDIPWFNSTTETYMSTSKMGFHPTTQNKLLFAEGIGFWTATLAPAGTSIAWVSQSAGIEELVANLVLATPNQDLILAAYDRPIWKITNPNIYQSSHYIPPASTTPAINHCWALDYASSDPDCIVAIISGQAFNTNYSAVSADGGDTWTEFAADVTEGVEKGAGCVAASTPTNWIVQATDIGAITTIGPKYTINGGASWSACSFSDGVTDFTYAHVVRYYNRHIVCADRVAANTFYYFLCKIDGSGHVYRSTDSGATLTKRTASSIVTNALYHAKLKSVPGKEGHIWFTPGHSGGLSDYLTPAGAFQRSSNGGTDWATIADVLEVYDFCFGVAAPGATYPTIYLAGWVNGVWGIYYSTDECVTFTKIGDWPLGSLDLIACMDADKRIFGKLYVGFQGSGFAYFDGAPEGYRRFLLTAS